MHSQNWKQINDVFLVETKSRETEDLRKTDLVISSSDFLATHLGQEMKKPVECLKALYPFIRYYQFFGFLPISIAPGNTGLLIRKPNPLWIFTGISFLIQTVMSARAVRDLISLIANSSTVGEEVEAANSVIYFFHTLSMYIIMLQRLKLLPGFIESCKKVEILCRKYQSRNDSLVNHCWMIFAYFACSQLLGNILYYYSIVERNNITSPVEYSLSYSMDNDGTLNTYVISGFALSIFEFYCDCGWLFGDTMISLVSFTVTRYFCRLNKGMSSSRVETVNEIEELRKDHRAIKDLVEQCNQVFSPIILVNFIGNTGYLLTRLYTGLSEGLSHSNFIVRLEVIYAFGYQITKILVPTWLAAILHETAHEPLDTVHDWPSMTESSECKNRILVINRFVSQLVNDPVGLSGCGYFTISKSFMVTMISGIITYEVIILQFQQSGL